MPLTNAIVSSINTVLENNLKHMAKVSVKGIAEPIPRDNGKEGIEWIPCVIDNEGEATYVGLDDVFEIQIYHRCFEEIYINGKAQYGDANLNDKGKANMSLVIIGNREKLRTNANTLNDIIIPLLTSKTVKIPNQSGSIIVRASVVHSKTNFKSFEIFSRDFKGVEYFLKPETIFMEMVYTIESEFNRSCFNICNTCND